MQGLRSDALIGIAFMDQYPTVIDTGLKMVAAGGEALPIRLVDWDKRIDRQNRKPVDVVAMYTATVPSQMGLRLPVRVVNHIPEQWRQRTMLFAPSKSFCESSSLEVANVVANGSQSIFYVRVANFKKVPGSVDAGFIIGTHSDEERNPKSQKIIWSKPWKRRNQQSELKRSRLTDTYPEKCLNRQPW